ncbi:MAG: hypothetical protein FWD68_08160 [Alphaproteobacteria bacterium]|nr:hypothetical protein [Alphaproteobacteria bacterium]
MFKGMVTSPPAEAPLSGRRSGGSAARFAPKRDFAAMLWMMPQMRAPLVALLEFAEDAGASIVSDTEFCCRAA